MPKAQSFEKPPVGESFILGYDAGNSQFPIIGIARDPQAGLGMTVPAMFDPHPDTTKYPNHIFTGISVTKWDDRVLWTYMILPGAPVYAESIDPETGIVISIIKRAVRNGTHGGIIAWPDGSNYYTEVQPGTAGTAVQIGSRIDAAQLDAIAFSYHTKASYPWPTVLTGITPFQDSSTGTVTPNGTFDNPTNVTSSASASWNAEAHLAFKEGATSKADARIDVSFSIGPPISIPDVTKIQCSIGTIIIQGGSWEKSIGYHIGSSGNVGTIDGNSNSVNFKAITIPACITDGYNGTIAAGGAFIASVAAKIAPSTPLPSALAPGHTIVADVQVTRSHFGLYRIEKVTITVP